MTPVQLYDFIRNSSFDAGEELASESELYMYMSQAETIMAKTVGCAKTTTTSVTVAAQKEYTKPDCLKIHRLTYDTVKLKKIDLRRLDEVEGTAHGGITTSGSPVYYYEWGNVIGLSPTPAEVKTLKFYIVARPTILTASSTDFTIDSEFAIYLADYCLYKMYIKDQQMSEADRYLKQWKEGLEEALSDYTDSADADRIQTIKLEEEMPGTQIGVI